MQRLRHPIRAIREPFGKAGLTVAVLALVLAMVGGAYAAGGLTSQQEKQVKKIAKKYAGKPGAAGPAGTAGTNGTNGKDGTNGTGTQGAPGKSVVIGTVSTCGVQGGKTIEVEGSPGTKQNVCNGQTGFTETLPSDKTETGTWATAIPKVLLIGAGPVPISFNIPLATALPEANIQINPEGFPVGATQGQEENCPGEAEEPKAAGGFLCVYTITDETHPVGQLVRSTTTAGVALFILSEEEGKEAFGTWAVTAE